MRTRAEPDPRSSGAGRAARRVPRLRRQRDRAARRTMGPRERRSRRRSLRQAAPSAASWAPWLPPEVGGAGLRHDHLRRAAPRRSGAAARRMRSLLTVHDMVCQAILRWGSRAPEGALAAAPGAGRGPRRLRASPSPRPAATPRASDHGRGSGRRRTSCSTARKKWITFGQIADLFLVFAALRRQAHGVPRASGTPPGSPSADPRHPGHPGLDARRAAARGCRSRTENMVGRPGFGVSHVVAARPGAGPLQRGLGLGGHRPGLPRRLPGLYAASAGSSACRCASTSSSGPMLTDMIDRRARRAAALPAGRLPARHRRPGGHRGDLGRQVLRLHQRPCRRSRRRRADPRRQRLQRRLPGRPLLPGRQGDGDHRGEHADPADHHRRFDFQEL